MIIGECVHVWLRGEKLLEQRAPDDGIAEQPPHSAGTTGPSGSSSAVCAGFLEPSPRISAAMNDGTNPTG